MTEHGHIRIFTDGSSRGNPGPGGWGSIVITSDEVFELGGREERTTNNRMELTAAIEALSFVGTRSENTSGLITVYTDSSYVMNGITKWIHGWQKNNWMTKAKEEVMNRDLWERLVQETEGKDIRWEHVKGHSGVPLNERVDEIATLFADRETPELYCGARGQHPVTIDETGITDAKQGSRKAPARPGSKKKPYSYVSEVDGVVKVHRSWPECEQRVKGKKARFRKVFSKEEEDRLIGEFRKG